MNVPATHITLHPKWGWQCLAGNGVTRGCYDGPLDRDDYHYAYPAGEGTRRSPAPLTNTTTEGIASTDGYNVFTLRDRVTGTLYDLTFGTTVAVTASERTAGYDALDIGRGWYIYVQDGLWYFASYTPSTGNIVPWNGAGALQVVNGALQYTPYVQDTVSL